MDDDLFTDTENLNYTADQLLGSDPDPVHTQETEQSQQTTKLSAMARQEYVESILERNMTIMDSAQRHFSQVQYLQSSIFGDSDAVNEFVDAVEHRLEQDEAFKARYDLMAEVHASVVAHVQMDNARYSDVNQDRPSRKRRSISSTVVVPGQPIQKTVESTTSKRNHLLRKGMI